MRRFAARYGWRAYAIPVLTVITVVALLNPKATRHALAAGSSALSAHSRTQRQTSGEIQQFALGTDATPCSANTTPHYILVSVSEQRVWMCERTTQVYSTLVTTGAVNVGDGTPIGTWQIQDHQTDRYLVGPGYRDFVHYWMPFNGDFGFHDAPWQTMPYGAPGYVDNGSHGCIHLPADAMQWLYNWAPVGTAVTIEL